MELCDNSRDFLYLSLIQLTMNYSNPNSIGYYDELPLWSAPFGLKLLDAVIYIKNITALDIGFGTGFPLIELAMRLGDSSCVYGIDPSPECHALVNNKINHHGLSNVRLIQGVAELIPLAEESVDLIVSNNGINNVNDMDAVFGECYRILKDHGRLIMTMNTETSMFEFYSAMKRIFEELELNGQVEVMKKHIYEKRKPIGEIIGLFERHNFTISNLEHDQFNYRFTDATAMLNHGFIKLAFKGPWMELCPEHLRNEVFMKIEQYLNIHAAANNGLNLSVPYVVINASKKSV